MSQPGQPAGGNVNSIIELANMLLGGLAAGMVLFIVSVGLSVTMGLMGFVNLAHGGFAMIGGYVIVLAMNKLGIPFLGEIPLAIQLRETSDDGRPVVATEPDGVHARHYIEIARNVWTGIGAAGRVAPRIVIE